MYISMILEEQEKPLWVHISKAALTGANLEKEGHKFRLGTTMSELPSNDASFLETNMVI
jgi:hypothetical protein